MRQIVALCIIITMMMMMTLRRFAPASTTREACGRGCAAKGARRARCVTRAARARAMYDDKSDDYYDDASSSSSSSSSTSRRVVTLMSATTCAISWLSPRAPSIAAPPPYGLYAPPPRSKTPKEPASSASTAERYVETLSNDLENKRYFFTGDLTTEIFADDCRFIDPTTNVKGVERYLRAVRVLFDDARSSVRLLGPLRLTSPTTIEGDYVAEGYLKLPWNPKVPAYEGHIVWTIAPFDEASPNAGLIVEQRQTWSVSGNKALLETFTPS